MWPGEDCLLLIELQPARLLGISVRSRRPERGTHALPGGAREAYVDNVPAPDGVEGLHPSLHLAHGVERPVALRLPQEYTDQAPSRKEGDVTAGELSPGLFDSHPKIGEETHHGGLEIYPAVEGDAPEYCVNRDWGKMAEEREVPLAPASNRSCAFDLGNGSGCAALLRLQT